MCRIPSADSPRDRLSYIDCLLRVVPAETSERQAGSLSCLHSAQWGRVPPCCSAVPHKTSSFSVLPAQEALLGFRGRVCQTQKGQCEYHAAAL